MKNYLKLFKRSQVSCKEDYTNIILNHLVICGPLETLDGMLCSDYLDALYKEAEQLAPLTARSRGKDKSVLNAVCYLRMAQYERLYPIYETKRAEAKAEWLRRKKLRWHWRPQLCDN